MAQRGTIRMALFFLAALLSLAGVAYGYAHGHGVDWYRSGLAVVLVGVGVCFKNVKRAA